MIDTAEEIAHLRALEAIAGLAASDVVPPAHRHVVVGAMRLHLVDWGTEGRLPIVFLHGGALTARTWDAVCLALRADYHCIAVDQRGHGDSEWSPACDYDLDAHLRDITLLVNELELEQFVLVGQSLGGINALRYASRHAERMAALVIVDVSPLVRNESRARNRVVEFMMEPGELNSLEEFVERAVRFNPRRDPGLLRYSLRHNLRRLPGGRWTWKYDRRHLSREWFDAVVERFREVAEELTDIGCPSLIVRGVESDVLSDEDVAALKELLPGARVAAIEDAGHNVQGDNPKGFVDALRPFLNGLRLADNAVFGG